MLETLELKRTPFHERTSRLSVAQNWRRWAGYMVVGSYDLSLDHEYWAIRDRAALIDVSPLMKYMIEGPDAARLLHKVTPRDMLKMKVGVVSYTGWCDEDGKLLDDGTDRAPRPAALPHDLGRAFAALARDERRRHGREGHRSDRSDGGAQPARPEVARRAQPHLQRQARSAQIFPRRRQRASATRRSASRAPATPAISATKSGWRPSTRSRCGMR